MSTVKYENLWIYNDKPFYGDNIDHLEGFVYLLVNSITGRYYIGKKSFWARKRTKKSSRRKTIESNWKNYYSSSEIIKADVKKNGGQHFIRYILHLCPNKLCMSYNETKEQFIRNVLFDQNYYNDTIMGKYYRSKASYYQSVHLDQT